MFYSGARWSQYLRTSALWICIDIAGYVRQCFHSCVWVSCMPDKVYFSDVKPTWKLHIQQKLSFAKKMVKEKRKVLLFDYKVSYRKMLQLTGKSVT